MYVISLGGSIVVPDAIDTEYLKKFKKFLTRRLKKGDKFFIVAGGGNLARTYQARAKEINPEISQEDLDWLGIEATRVNAWLLKTCFASQAAPKIYADFEKEEPELQNHPVAFAAGFKPGCSTDLDAVEWAQKLGADYVLNFTNVDYVYDKDLDKNPDAWPQQDLTWGQYKKIFGADWSPGLNAPFDPVAAKEAKRAGLKVVVLNGKNLGNAEQFFQGEEFKGTVIS